MTRAAWYEVEWRDLRMPEGEGWGPRMDQYIQPRRLRRRRDADTCISRMQASNVWNGVQTRIVRVNADGSREVVE